MVEKHCHDRTHAASFYASGDRFRCNLCGKHALGPWGGCVVVCGFCGEEYEMAPDQVTHASCPGPTPKIVRRMDTPEAREFWTRTEERVSEDDFYEAHGATRVVFWRIRWCMMWEMIGNLCSAPAPSVPVSGRPVKGASRFSWLEVD